MKPEPDLRGMVHRDDPNTSLLAAGTVERKRTELHRRVLDALQRYGPMTDEELEELPEFATYGPSTIRKRRSELFQAGTLISTGTRRNARNFLMLVWTLAPPKKKPRRSLLPPPPVVQPRKR